MTGTQQLQRTPPLPNPATAQNSQLRLHISPLNPTLLSTIINPSLLDKVEHVSYHTLETFPERNYGFITMPKADAEKLKKKLHGRILKGHKMHVDDARPDTMDEKKKENNKICVQGIEESAAGHRGAQATEIMKRDKKRRREEAVLPGVELENRKVKRGWTKPVEAAPVSTSLRSSARNKKEKNAVKNQSSAYTNKAECLFRTAVPSNTLPPITNSTKNIENSRTKRHKKELVVHEFAHTMKQSKFLREQAIPSDRMVTEDFVEGVGWVDAEGKLVETVPDYDARRKTAVAKGEGFVEGGGNNKKNLGQELSVPLSTIPGEDRNRNIAVTDDASNEDGETSESDSDSVSSPYSESSEGSEAPPIQTRLVSKSTQKSKPSILKLAPDTLHADLAITESTAPHPLEALFKKPKTRTKTPAALSTSFSFFEPDSNTTESMQPPQTPFSRRDFDERNLRSAAPPPDTPAPGTTFAFKIVDEDQDPAEASEEGNSESTFGSGLTKSEGDEIVNSPTHGGPASELNINPADADFEFQKSEFLKRFYEQRGEVNRHWKRRRREVGKERRRAENARKGGRV